MKTEKVQRNLVFPTAVLKRAKPVVCIGEISVNDVMFDPCKRKALDAFCLVTLLSQ